MKIKKILSPLLISSSLLAVSPIAVLTTNNIVFNNHYQSVNKDNKKSIINDRKNTINTATNNGFINYNNNVIYSYDFFGELLWEYDLNSSMFFKNENSDEYYSIVNFDIKYNQDLDTIAVFGNYNKSNNVYSFFFMLEAKDGNPYFINEDTNLDEVDKHQSSMLSNENSDFISNPSNVIFNGQYATFFNNDILKNDSQNVPVQISLYTYQTNKLSFDSTLFNELKALSYYDSLSLFGVTTLPNNNVLLQVGELENNSVKNYQVYMVNKSLKSITNNNKIVSIELINSTNDSKVYDINQLSNELVITSKTTDTYNVVLPIIDDNSSFKTFEYNSKNNTFTNYSKIIVDSSYKNIYSLTTDTVNKKIYFSTTNTTSTIGAFDLTTNAITKISDDSKYSNSNICSFLTSSTSSQFVINKLDNNNQYLYGFQTSIGGNTQGEVEIKIPEIRDYNDVAVQKQLTNIMPEDFTVDNAKSVVEIANYSTNEYNVSIVNDTLIPNNDLGTLEFNVNLNIMQWWDKAHTGYYQYLKSVKLDNLCSNNTNKFLLVTNSSVDETKYQKVNSFILNSFVDTITKQDILDYFISYGKNLSFTVDDISINNDIKDAQIQCTTDKNTGELSISYNIDANKDKTSLINDYKSGSFKFEFNKKISDYNQLTIDNNKLDQYKNTNYSVDLTVKDLVESIDFDTSGFGYSSNSNKYKWTYKYEVNSIEWINNLLEGRLEGTLEYIRDSSDPDNNSLSSDITKVDINQTGFKRLDEYIFGVKDSNNNFPSTFTFNQSLADSLTVTSNKDDAIILMKEIINQTVKTNNNWISPDQLQYTINNDLSNDNELYVDLYIAKNCLTNLSFNDLPSVSLNENWINALEKINPNLFDKFQIKFKVSVATYKWNIDKLNNNTDEISIGETNNDYLSSFKNSLPSKLVSSFDNKDELLFQELTNLLDTSNMIDNTKDSTNNDLNQFKIQNIQLTPNDSNGSLRVSYTLVYPNLNNVSKVATVNINGFLSTTTIIIFWVIIIAIIGLITVGIFIWVAHIKKKKKKYKVWSTYKYNKKYNRLNNKK